MSQTINLARFAVVLLFIITFVAVGTLAPQLHAQYAPQEEFIVVHGFEATNTSTDADSHIVCFDRTMKTEASANLIIELHKINGNDYDTEVNTVISNRLFQEGRTTVVAYTQLPPDLATGKYEYNMAIRMELADGEITRTFIETSEPFYVENNSRTNNVDSVSC